MTQANLDAFQRAWGRFAGWLAEHAPNDHAVLQPPATRQQVAAIEDTYGFPLHPELRALLHLHNGAPWDAARPAYGCFLPGSHRLSSVDDVLSTHEILMDFHDRFEEDWGEVPAGVDEPVVAHSHQWVPFAMPNDGGMAFVDHSPGPTYGHVYEFGMGSGASEVTLWGTSLAAFFQALATAVETGTPFQDAHPTFFELLRADLPSFDYLVGQRLFEWNHSPQDPPFDESYVIHRITADGDGSF